MTIYHLMVIMVGALLEGYAIYRDKAGDATAIVALIIGAAAGNAQTRQGQRATDATVTKDERK